MNFESESKKIYTDVMETVEKTLCKRDVLKLLLRAKQPTLYANQAPLRANQA